MDTVVNGAAIIGFVNALGMWFPNLESKYKLLAAALAGAILPFVPFDSSILGTAFAGVELALATSGVYKLTQVAGLLVRK